MKSKKVKKILLIALTCVAISASVSAEAAMKSQITIESKNKYEQLKISESRVYGEYPTGDYKKIMLRQLFQYFLRNQFSLLLLLVYPMPQQILMMT